MPLEMWAVTGYEWPYGLSHALSCVLLLASLSSNQVNRVVGKQAAFVRSARRGGSRRCFFLASDVRWSNEQ